MERVFPDVYRYLSDSQYGSMHSFVLVNAQGNLLIPCGAPDEDTMAEIESLGGLSAQIMTDRHFVNAHNDVVCERFAAPVYCHRADYAETRSQLKGDVIAFDNPKDLPVDYVDAVHTPGHCEGGVCYLLDIDGERLAFTGDFLVPAKLTGFTIPVIGPNHADAAAGMERLIERAPTRIVPGVYDCALWPTQGVIGILQTVRDAMRAAA